MYINDESREILKLVPVRAVLFFVAGALVCANGGVVAFCFTAAAFVIAAVVCVKLRRWLVCAAALFIGAAVMTGYIAFVVEPLLENSGTTQSVSFTVTDKSGSGYFSYECTAVIDGRITDISIYSEREFDIGDKVTANVELEKIEYDSKLPVHRRLLKGTVDGVVSVYSPAFSLLRSMSEFRQQLSDEMLAYCDREYRAFGQGLLFGDTSNFSLALSHAAKICGIAHFTAVSGSHFVIIMSVMLELFGRHKKLRAVASGIFIVMAVLFFGAEPTVVRAGLMLFLCNCGPLFARKADTLNSLCVAVIVMTVSAPYVILDIGFQMSVLGVFGVSVVGSGCSRIIMRLVKVPVWLRQVVNMLVASACATICVAPVSVAAFGGISLIGVFVTVIFTPLFTLILTMAVVYVVLRLQILSLLISLLVKVSYHFILFMGSDSRLWLVLDHKSAGLFALGAAVFLTLAVVLTQRYTLSCFMIMTALMTVSCVLSVVGEYNRRKIDFVSDGDSGAAVVCVRDEATVFICGNGDRLAPYLADSLLRNGIDHLRLVAAADLGWAGAFSLGKLNELYTVEAVVSANAIDELQRFCPEAALIEREVTQISADGLTIACAKSGDTECTADIVLYTSYKMSVPDHGAELLPLYVSSRQNHLPEGGINIYDTDFELSLEN